MSKDISNRLHGGVGFRFDPDAWVPDIEEARPRYPVLFGQPPAEVYNPKPFGDLCAEDYLEFAMADRAQHGDRALVNALGNAKRALHYIVERTAFYYGLNHVAVKNFPTRVAVLAEFDLLPASILRTFNRYRNDIEHDYVLPSRERLDDMLDLCELVLRVSDRLLIARPSSLAIRLRGANDFKVVDMVLGRGVLKIDDREISIRKHNTSDWETYIKLFVFAAVNRPLST